MMTTFVHDLGNGMRLKQVTLDDVERLADYNAHHLNYDGPDEPAEILCRWTKI